MLWYPNVHRERLDFTFKAQRLSRGAKVDVRPPADAHRMGEYDVGKRPDKVFLVYLEKSQQPFFLVWKDHEKLLWVRAGFERSTKSSIEDFQTTDPSIPTVASIAHDFHAAWKRSGDLDPPQAWDVSDHVGLVYPRVYRPEILHGCLDSPRATRTTEGRHAVITSAVAAAQLLFDDLDALSAVIEPVQSQLSVFGHKPRQSLLLACMEVDSAMKAIAKANGSTIAQPNMTHHSRLAGPMRLGEWEVRLGRSIEGLTFEPFRGWSQQNARLPWYSAYNETKHGRESHLHEAQMQHVLDAAAAVYILLLSQFGPEAHDQLHHPPFEIVKAPTWEPYERYVLSPFEGDIWSSRGYFA